MSGAVRPAASGGGGDGAIESEKGPLLVQRLHGLMRGLRLYSRSNQTMLNGLTDLAAVLAAIPGDETLLVVLGEYLYVNGFRLRPTPSQTGLFRAFQGELEGRGLAGIRFRAGVPTAELEAFLSLLLAHTAGKDAPEHFQQRCSEVGIGFVVPILARDLAGQQAAATEVPEPAADAGQEERQRAQQIFRFAVQGTRKALTLSAQTGRPAIQQARRVVQPMVDRIMKNEYSIIGLTALKNHDEHTYVHCVNVSILSIRMGQALGLSRVELANLGVAALLHDIGKITVPIEVLQKPGRLDAAEWAAIHRHPKEGFKIVCRLPNLTGMMLEASRVALQHHMNVDGSGYPKPAHGATMATSSRIVAVADFFDAVTGHRAYRARPMTPFEALQLVLRDERPKFDAAALWGLVQAVGCYPAGSVLATASGHTVLSISPTAKDLRRPNCRVLVYPDGSTPPEDAPLLWRPMPPGESVARVLSPEEFGLDDDLLMAA
jgi:HD-GYP domain-containing protein (c-di-GMP phosphodiesterase class II)